MQDKYQRQSDTGYQVNDIKITFRMVNDSAKLLKLYESLPLHVEQYEILSKTKMMTNILLLHFFHLFIILVRHLSFTARTK